MMKSKMVIWLIIWSTGIILGTLGQTDWFIGYLIGILAAEMLLDLTKEQLNL